MTVLRRWRRLIIRILLIAIGMWLAIVVLLAYLIHRTGTVEQAQPSDVIVVLGAGLARDGTAGRALTRRSQHAAALWQAGYAQHIICTGGIGHDQTRSEADACRELLQQEGVPTSAIWLEDRSRSTEENALYTAAILLEKDWQTVILVSDGYHLFRADYIFKTYGIRATLSPVSYRLIRGFPTYEYSLMREIAALHWQVFKTIFRLPVTYVPLG